MSSSSDLNFDNLVEYLETTGSPHEASQELSDLKNFVSAERQLSRKISKQQFENIEDHIDRLQVHDLDAQSLDANTGHAPHSSVRPGIPVAFDEIGVCGYGSLPENASGAKATLVLSPDLHERATFSSRGQSRTGSHHGRGGRRKGSGFQVRRNYSIYAKSVICKRMLDLYSMSDFQAFNFLLKELLYDGKLEGSLSDVSSTFKGRFTSALKESIVPLPYSIQELPFCVLGVSARFSKSDSISSDTSTTRSSMSRHIANTWVDCNGGLRCTCLGSTQYSILAQNSQFNTPSCEHTKTFLDVLDSIAELVFDAPCLSPSLLFTTISTAVPDLVNPLADCFPFFRYIHRNQTVIYVCEDTVKDLERCWVPIRCVQRKGTKFLCAFCDSISTNACHHVKFFSSLRNNPLNSNVELFEGEPGHSTELTQNSSESVSHNPRTGPISYLPVSPVNCEKALRTDFIVCQNVRDKKTYVLNAPSSCIYCDGLPISGSEKMNTSGIIMCTIGACSMKVQTVQCSKCFKRYSSEGRRESVYLESICSASTHALLRSELLGFALGNGTLNSRLNQVHSHFAALEDASMSSNIIPSLSTKTMFRMCTGLARLAVIDPPMELFWCSVCQTKTEGTPSVPKLLCIDGIWAGYLRRSQKAFHNVIFAPNMEKSSTRAVWRPKTTLVRLERAVTFLLHAIKGEKIEVTSKSVNAAVAAVRLVNCSVLPADFYYTSVCGRTATDFDSDVRSGPLQKIQDLTSFIFDERTLLYRLLKPILTFFQGTGKRRKSRKGTQKPFAIENLVSNDDSHIEAKRSTGRKRKKTLDPESCCLILSQALQISPLGQNDLGDIPWNLLISDMMKKDDIGKKILSLYRSLIQGPVTHLLPKKQLKSARILVESCMKDDPEFFMRRMVSKEKFDVWQASTETYSNIVKLNRVILAGLFSAAIVDNSIGSRSNLRLLPLLGSALLAGISVVEIFYEFYDSHMNEANGSSISADYAKEWSSSDHVKLRKQFQNLANTSRFQHDNGTNYDDVYTTGTFFPSFPQIRPLLFNVEGGKVSDLDHYGFCSKHYWQVKGSFTPGAVTFCCGCAHPIVLGFNVLEWDEGPRAILDVLVSRLPSFPRYLVYDFACGVYKSAAHTLSWAIEDSTLVSDPFHGSNHKCSPFFTKTAHIPLDTSNTISHEQRNRPIAKIKSSLQQTSQETYISLLAFQIMVNNISAQTKTAARSLPPVKNRSATDLEWGYFKRLNLVCMCCNTNPAAHQGRDGALELEEDGVNRDSEA